MEKRHDLYQDEHGDTLPGPGAERRADGDLEGQEMQSTTDGRTGEIGSRHVVMYTRCNTSASTQENLFDAGVQLERCYEIARQHGWSLIGQITPLSTKVDA